MIETVNFYPHPHEENDSLGTTLIAVKYDNGIVLATDSLTSRGSFVSTFNKNKIRKLWDNIYIMACGSAAHSIFLNKILSDNLEYHSLEKKSNPLVYTAAHILRGIIYQNKNLIESAFIICGFDEKKGFQIYTVHSNGSLVENEILAKKGSGGTHINAYLDDLVKPNLSYAEAKEIVTKGVYLATRADISSGSHINFVNFTKEGGVYEKIENKVKNM